MSVKFAERASYIRQVEVEIAALRDLINGAYSRAKELAIAEVADNTITGVLTSMLDGSVSELVADAKARLDDLDASCVAGEWAITDWPSAP